MERDYVICPKLDAPTSLFVLSIAILSIFTYCTTRHIFCHEEENEMKIFLGILFSV